MANQESVTNLRSLPRVLGPVMASAVVVGTIIGSGVFKKAYAITQDTPYFGVILLLWVGGGIFTFLGALAYAEVVTLFPRAGGNYTFLKEAYGPMWGFLWGWVDFVMIRSASLAALASIFTDSFCDLINVQIPFWGKLAITISVLISLSCVNIRGARLSGSLQVFLTIIKVVSLVMIALVPLYFFTLGAGEAKADFKNLEPWWAGAGEFGFSHLFSAFLAILWAYHGWGNIAPVAEEIKDPQRNIPLALLGGVGLVTLLYVGVNIAYHLVLPMESIRNLPGGSTVATEAMKAGFGQAGVLFASAAIMISVFGSLNGNILAGPRLLYAMGKENMAPAMLQEVHPVYQTPYIAIMVLGVWSSVLVILGGVGTSMGMGLSLFDLLTNFSMFGAVIFETMGVLSIFVFRRIMPDFPRPYKCWGYPFTPLLYAVIPACVLGNMFFASHTNELGIVIYPHHAEVYSGITFLAVGVAVYYAFIKPYHKRTQG